jgi:hypothetical protein
LFNEQAWIDYSMLELQDLLSAIETGSPTVIPLCEGKGPLDMAINCSAETHSSVRVKDFSPMEK